MSLKAATVFGFLLFICLLATSRSGTPPSTSSTTPPSTSSSTPPSTSSTTLPPSTSSSTPPSTSSTTPPSTSSTTPPSTSSTTASTAASNTASTTSSTTAATTASTTASNTASTTDSTTVSTTSSTTAFTTASTTASTIAPYASCLGVQEMVQSSTYSHKAASLAVDGNPSTCSQTGSDSNSWIKLQLRCLARVSHVTLSGSGLDDVHVVVGNDTEPFGFRDGGHHPSNVMCAYKHSLPSAGKVRVSCETSIMGRYVYVYSVARRAHQMVVCDVRVQ